MGLSGRIPNRVDAATKTGLIGLVDGAVADGWSMAGACRYLELSQRRLQRWHRRVDSGVGLDDHVPGGNPVHGLTPAEEDEIVAVFDVWAEVDRSHRKLAHRGSWLGRFWADPSTVRRVLERRDVAFSPSSRSGPVETAALAGMGRGETESDLDLRHHPLVDIGVASGSVWCSV